MLVPLRPDQPRGDQIYVRYREAILAGRLRAGDRLPATRALARRLGVARNTVVAAFSRLAAEGYVEGHGAAGTRVAARIPPGPVTAPLGAPVLPSGAARGPRLLPRLRRLARSEGVFPPAARRATPLRWDFQYNVNVCDRTALRAWHRALRRAAAAYDREPGTYDLSRRPGKLSRAIARHLAPSRGVRCEPDQVLVLSGSQQAFQLAARLLAEPGDTVVIEEPARLGPREAFLANDLRVVAAPTDEQGLRVDRLPRNRRVCLICVAPSSCWPTGAVLPLDRRLRLLEWAREQDAWILEHDHNSEHGHGGTPVVSVQGLDEDRRVVYAGTFSRLLSPEPEVAYAVVPESLVQPFLVAQELESYWCSELELDALAMFLEAGELESLLRRLARRLRPLRETLLEAVDALPRGLLHAARSGTGLHVHAVAPGVPAAEAGDVLARCAAAGVGVFPDNPYRLRKAPAAGFLLGFARMTPPEIREGISRLGKVLAERK